eukprot:gene4776-34534_t
MAQPIEWPAGKPFTPPTEVISAGPNFRKPPMKDKPSQIAPHMEGLRTDEEFDSFMKQQKASDTTVVQFGSTWCTKCVEIFPAFYDMSKKFTKMNYAVAQVDYMKEATKNVKYSPSFFIYKGGRKVDEVVGKDLQKLEDHLWLHNDE